ncbi:MAG: hypothetical protein Q9216_006652 [Gyalolechia sp. 2 TL-2023]
MGLMRHAFPIHDPGLMYPWRLRQLNEGFQKEFHKHFKIVDTSKCIIVSYASWECPHPAQPKEASQGRISDSDIPETSFPAGSNIQMVKDFYNERDKIKAKYIDPTQDYYLRGIFTDPEYQRQGLGSMLMRKGLASIDAEGRRCYLEATPAGLPMYLFLVGRSSMRLGLMSGSMVQQSLV